MTDVPDLTKALEHRQDLEASYGKTVSAEHDMLKIHVLKYERIDVLMEHIIGYDVTPCHMSMLIHQSSCDKTMTLAPRGIGKSVTMTVVRCIYELIKNPNIRILIVSNTQLQAEIFLREIKEHFSGNEKLISIFGNMVGSKWDSKEINMKTRTTFAKESSVSCCGVGGAIIGRHYDLIIGDDLVDEENSRTEAQRDKFKTWYYKSLDPCLEPDGRMFIHGTRYYPSDFYGHLSKYDEDYKTRVYPAIDKNGTSIWPSKMPVEWLKKKKKAMGTAIFNTQYQNDVTSMEGKIFKFEWFRYYDILPQKLRIITGVDLAITVQSTSDYFSTATIGVDEFGRIYLIDIYEERLSFLQQTKKIISKTTQFTPRRVFIESNNYQKAQSDLLQIVSMVPVRPVVTLTDKVTRARTLSGKFENGNVFFPRQGAQEFIDQMIAFPDCEHDDMFDAFEIAVSGAFKSRKKSRRDFGVI